MKFTNIFIAIICINISCGAQIQSERHLHTPNLQPLVMRVINKKTFLGYDSGFVASISQPSEYLGDFFGIQAVKNNSKEKIINDFTPKNATLISNDSNTVVLDFEWGGRATFYVNTSLVVSGNQVPIDHIAFDGETYQDFLSSIESFKALLKQRNLTKQYLIPNPYYKEEQVVYRKIQSEHKNAEVTVDTTFSGFSQWKSDALLIVPDNVHGNMDRYNFLMEAINSTNFDWFALEMLSIGSQNALNDFLTKPKSSEEYVEAESALVKFYEKGWQFKFEGEEPSEHPFMTLFRKLRAMKKKAYAMENDDITYLVFRYGEAQFGGAVRSLLWAQRIPANGKGIVFGGGGHLTNDEPLNFQDFYKDIAPKSRIFSALELKRPKY